MKQFGKSLVFLITLLSLACVKVESPDPVPNYSVYGVISPMDEYIQIFFGKTFALGEAFSIDSMKFVPNAKVTLTSNGVIKELKFNSKSKEYESMNNGFLRENQTYQLNIYVGKDSIFSTTTIPVSPKLILVEGDVSGNNGQVRVSWNKTTTTNANYRLTGAADFDTPFVPFFYWDSEFYVWTAESRNFPESTILSPLGNFDFAQYTDADVTIELESLDAAWYDFEKKLGNLLRQSSFTKKFEAPIFFKSNIKNAVGVFGSYSKNIIQFKITKP